MKKLYQTLGNVCYALGVLCLVAGVLLRFVPDLSESLAFSPRGAIIFAGSLFLCALASQSMTRAESS